MKRLSAGRGNRLSAERFGDFLLIFILSIVNLSVMNTEHYWWTSAYHAAFSMKGKCKHSPQNLLKESKFAALALNKYRHDFASSKRLWPKKSTGCVLEVWKRQRSEETGSGHHDNIQIKTWIVCLYLTTINLDCFQFVKCHEQHLHSKNSWSNSIKLAKAERGMMYYIAFLPWRHQ